MYLYALTCFITYFCVFLCILYIHICILYLQMVAPSTIICEIWKITRNTRADEQWETFAGEITSGAQQLCLCQVEPAC